MRRRATLLAGAALVVAGCGGGSSSSDSSDTTSQKPAKTEAPKASSAAASQSAKASIKDFTFGPETVTVKAGGTVSWTNKDSANHNVQFSDKSVKGIGNLRQGQSGKVSFAKAGTYKYVCSYHPGMEGKVVVQ